MIKMEIKGLSDGPGLQHAGRDPAGPEKGLFLPIWVGIFEANAIALEMEKVSTPRPMTHDLLKNLLAELDTRVERVVINDLRDNTFFARIHLTRGEATRSRSTAGRATRSRSPCARRPRSSSRRKCSRRAAACAPSSEQDPERLKKWLEEASPDELGKYRM